MFSSKWDVLNTPNFWTNRDKPWQTHTHTHTHACMHACIHTLPYLTLRYLTLRYLTLRCVALHYIHTYIHFETSRTRTGFMGIILEYLGLWALEHLLRRRMWVNPMSYGTFVGQLQDSCHTWSGFGPFPKSRQSSKSDSLLGESARWFSQQQSWLCSGIFQPCFDSGNGGFLPFSISTLTRPRPPQAPQVSLNALHPLSWSSLCDDLGTADGCQAPERINGAVAVSWHLLELDEIMKRLPVPAVWSPRRCGAVAFCGFPAGWNSVRGFGGCFGGCFMQWDKRPTIPEIVVIMIIIVWYNNM